MKRPVLMLLITLILTGCIPGQPNYNRLWFYTYNSDSGPSDIGLTPASFIELKPNRTFTRDFGKFEYGSWDVNQRDLLLYNQFGQKVRLGIRYLRGNDLQLYAKDSAIANFEAQDLPVAAEDPFSKEKNLWRLKAEGNETDRQIKDRLTNHCVFWATYFKWAMENKFQMVDVRSTPTLIKIYGNGFTIKPYDDLPEAWKSCFYDAADCRKANEIMEETIKRNTIAWAHTDNKYKMFISAFQQLQQFLK